MYTAICVFAAMSRSDKTHVSGTIVMRCTTYFAIHKAHKGHICFFRSCIAFKMEFLEHVCVSFCSDYDALQCFASQKRPQDLAEIWNITFHLPQV